jgi:hypothetical protein
MCRESKGVWVADPELPDVLAHWLKDMITHVRGDVDPGNPASSALGEDKKLFLLSGGGGPWLGNPNADQAEIDRYNRPFTIPELDLIDIHVGFNNDYLLDKGKPDPRNHEGYANAKAYWNRFPSQNAPVAERKPFNHGEYTHYTVVNIDLPGSVNDFSSDLEYIFHNYNVTYHNELWSSAFSGKFAAGTSWNWHRVFWWPRAMPNPPADAANIQLDGTPLLGDTGHINNLDLNLGFPIQIKNRPVHHHFRSLAYLLNHPSWVALNFFDNELVVGTVYDPAPENPNLLECYFMRSAAGDAAIGWVHNRKASSMNNFYIKNSASTQNYFGCEAPIATSFLVPGLLPSTEYHITWFPTWENSTVCPLDTIWMSNASGELFLDLSSAPLGDTIQFFTDTLHADYAFIITLDEFVKSRSAKDAIVRSESGMDFSLFPNPARQDVFVQFRDDAPKDIMLLDMTGRNVIVNGAVTSALHHIAVGELAKGPYFIRVSDGIANCTKRLIIH